MGRSIASGFRLGATDGRLTNREADEDAARGITRRAFVSCSITRR